MPVATAEAHPNIAVVKYWGKRDVVANLPAVPSVSLALGPWRTRTTVTWGAQSDAVRLAGAPASAGFARKALAHLDRLVPNRPPVEVDTENDFPTGAGLASSASGFAALTLAGAAAAGLDLDATALSALARRGSGSASRSVPGGWARWWGEAAESIAPADWWDVRMVVAVIAEQEKELGSTEGMSRSAATSPYWPAWVTGGPGDADEAVDAIRQRDLPRLGEVMESSTFKMHATMHTARPPLIYWQPGSIAVIHEVHALRRSGVGAWITLDAGPQVKVLCAAPDADVVAAALAPLTGRVAVLRPGGPALVVDGPAR
jgi:diphosphomevalonate decarboxylase